MATLSSDQSQGDPQGIAYWNQRWIENRTGFHLKNINPYLLQYIGLMTGQAHSNQPVTDPSILEKNSKQTWFLPLCGKTVDIPYLLSQGFRVFGVEAVKSAIEQLDSEHGLCMNYEPDRKLYTGVSGRLQIYVGDMFTCPIHEFGPFDYVWDRGAFIAVESSEWDKYSSFMQRALRDRDGTSHHFNYLLETVLYDKSVFEGPPRSVSDEEMENYFGSWGRLQLLSSEDATEKSIIFKAVDGKAKIRIFHITPKNIGIVC